MRIAQFYFILVIFNNFYFILSLNLKNCRLALGMQSGEIPDDALSASSSFDINTVGPKYSRIRTETNGGAWCPKSQIHSNSYEYLEINLSNLTVITSVETQGRFGNGLGQEYAENYMLEYKREDDKTWIRYKNRLGETILSGNSNTYIAEMREISPPILAKRIRFIPYSKTRRTICLRVELYGCSYQDGIIWYQIPQGDRRNDIDLIDNSYDGTMENNILKDGLGQLTDGELGDDDFRAETFYFGMKGYEWIGWKKNFDKNIQMNKLLNNNSQIKINYSDTLTYVPLAFKFDYLRNFSSVLIHCNNMFTKDSQVFSKAIVQFSLNGVFTNGRHSLSTPKNQLVFDVPNDLHNESARYIKLELANHLARYIRIKLYFSTKWLLISEIDFNSVPIVQTQNEHIIFNSNIKSNYLTETIQQNTSLESHFIKTSSTTKTITTPTTTTTTMLPQTTPILVPSIISAPLKQYYLVILVISTLILISILGLIFAVILLNKQRYKNKTVKLHNIIQQKHLYGDGVYTNIPLNMNLTAELASFIKKQSSLDTPKYFITPLNGTQNRIILKTDQTFSTATTSLSSSTTGSDQNKNNTNAIFQPYHLFQPTTENSSDNDSREYCTPDITTPILHEQIPRIDIIKSFFNEIETKTALLNETTPYASVDILDHNNDSSVSESIQGVCGNVTFLIDNRSEFLKLPTLEENLQKVKLITFINQISDGQFGKIYTVSLTNKETNDPDQQLLIAKILINISTDTNTLNKSQQSFLEEVSVRSRLNHINLANMVGYCENPYCLITEYKTELGHLDEYLNLNAQSINYSTQLLILLQISSAMKYLEQLNITHRDLAIRNCLVYNTISIDQNENNKNLNLKNILIKISDIAICLPEYQKDYYNYNNTKLLPIRYMPAEALFEGLYSPSSDIWSFGILIWQLFTNCKSIPFAEWSNNDYLYNLKLSMYSLVLTVNSELKETNQLNKQLLISTTLHKQHNNKQLNNEYSQFSSLKPKTTIQYSKFDSCLLDTKDKLNDIFIKNCLNTTIPFNCTKEINDLLIECCNMNMIKRPKFKDIYLFLQCKLFGSKF